MSAQLENLLSHLDKVKRTGKNAYLACCPAHADKHPSLTVRETASDAILIHCFSGCDTESVLSAIGLTFNDLYPPRQHHGKPESRPFPAADVLRALSLEIMIVALAGRSILSKSPFTESDQARLVLAVNRIQSAISAGGLNHV